MKPEGVIRRYAKGLEQDEAEQLFRIAEWRATKSWVEGKGACFDTWVTWQARGEFLAAKRRRSTVRNADLVFSTETQVSGNDGKDTTWGELHLRYESDPVELLEVQDLLEKVKNLLTERQYMTLYRTLGCGETLDAVGKSYGLTRQRMEQIRSEALEKVRRVLT